MINNVTFHSLRRPVRQGSALIIMLLIISVISTASFSITALALSEFRKAGALQDSVAAYYSAESGIEHGLMQYRLWKDAELSREAYQDVHAGLPVSQAHIPTKSPSQGQPQTFRLSGGSGAGYAVNAGDKGTAWYDLKMWYRNNVIGKVQNEADPASKPVVDETLSPRVYRDSAVQFSVKGADSLELAWQADPDTLQRESIPGGLPNIDGVDYPYFVELILSTSDSTCPSNLRLERVIFEAHRSFPVAFNCDYETLRIKPWGLPYVQYSLVLRANNQNTKFDNQISSILSTGYVGKAKRTLQVDINRSSGSLLEAADFLILSGDKNLNY